MRFIASSFFCMLAFRTQRWNLFIRPDEVFNLTGLIMNLEIYFILNI